VIPSLSKTTEPFSHSCVLLLANEIPSVYVNCSEFGGTKFHARSGKGTYGWPHEKHGTDEVRPNAEAIVIAEIDVDEQAGSSGTAWEHRGITVHSYAPFIYRSESYYSALKQLESAPKDNLEFGNLVKELTNVPEPLPSVLRSNLIRLEAAMNKGTARPEDIELFLEKVEVSEKTSTVSTVRSKSLLLAIESLTGISQTTCTLDQARRSARVLRHLHDHQLSLLSESTLNPDTHPLSQRQQSLGVQTTEEGLDLLRSLNLFQDYLGEVGFERLGELSVRISESTSEVRFSAKEKSFFVPLLQAVDKDVARRELTLQLLRRNLNLNPRSQVNSFIDGLAYYYPCSYANRPNFGRVTAQRLGIATGHVLNLEDAASHSDPEHAATWAGFCWQLRERFEKKRADKILFTYWGKIVSANSSEALRDSFLHHFENINADDLRNRIMEIFKRP
jgi:hypothetical protein